MLKSSEPDTILVPSGEKPTDCTALVWTLVCSSTSANVDASASRITTTPSATAHHDRLPRPLPTGAHNGSERCPPHSRMLEPDADTILEPSGEKHIESASKLL
mmetsp:Transcript_15185/g.45556  ORF Transcript_15185/g.45556 Transcript_15185/m.45556 type:complete len:103 (-) Transcript_15185:336-644(-)